MAGIGPSSSKIDQIIAEFFVKCLHIILEARIPILPATSTGAAGGKDSPASSSASSSSLGFKSKDRWFNLVLGEVPSAQESAEPWRRNPSSEPMIVDILLVRSPGWQGDAAQRCSRGASPDSWSGGEAEDSSYGTVLERWIISHERLTHQHRRSSSPGSHALEVPGIYKRAVILMRTLYCSVRTLPAHRLFHLSISSSQSRSFSLTYKVSASPPPLPEPMEVRTFAPVETPTGRLCVSVAYRHTTAVTALEVTPPILPRIIADYVGSPTTDPLRRLSAESLTGSVPSGGISGRRGVHVVSLPTSVPSSSSGIGRRHSWGGGLNKMQPTLLPPSSPSFKSSRSPSPSQPQPDFYHPSPPRHHSPLHYINSPQRNSSQPIPIQERRLSPPNPFSHSPPAVTSSNSLESSLPRYIPRHTSAPVSIPKPSGFRQQHTISDRSSLPPPSPSPRRSFEQPHQQHQQVSRGMEGGLGPRLSVSTLAESLLLISPPHPYHSHQAGSEDRVEEGPPSGVKRSLYGSPRIPLSRSSSKIHDEADDEEFACPFAYDDDEVEELRSRSGSPRNRQGNIFEPSGPKSQHAAVGALVRLLKSAPPLHGRTGSDIEPSSVTQVSVVARSKSRPIPGAHKVQRYRNVDVRVDSFGQQQQQQTIRNCKTAGEALEELESYKEMQKEVLIRQGGRKCTEKQLPSSQLPNVYSSTSDSSSRAA